MKNFTGSHRVPAGLLGLALLTGCRAPLLKVRDQAPQAVELVLDGQRLAPDDQTIAPLAQRLGLPVRQGAASPERVLRVSLKSQPPGRWSHSRPQTMLVHSGLGLVLGGALVARFSTGVISWPTVAAGAGVGALAGLGTGWMEYEGNQTCLAQVGFLPWTFSGTLEAVNPGPDPLKAILATAPAPNQQPRRYLQRVPEPQPSEASIRQESLRAYLEALGAYLETKGFGRPQPKP